MMKWIFPSLLGFASGIAKAQDCDDYGQISPSEADGYTGSELIFRISQANNALCDVDPSLCEWEIDGEPDVAGTLDAETGSPVTWIAPDEIDDCSGYSFQIIATCADASQVGSAIVTMYCDDEDKNALQEQSRETTVQGGGCGSTVAAASLLIFPVGLIGWRRR